MELELVPLLSVARELLNVPRGYGRFQAYLRALFQDRDEDDYLMPMVAMNPMSREHVTALVDDLLAIDAERIAAEAIAEALPWLTKVPGAFKVGLVVSDDLKGGWTNRYASEFTLRFGAGLDGRSGGARRWACWVSAVLWSSEPASVDKVREAVLTPLHRMSYSATHPKSRTLRERLAQEGHVMAAAGCTRPTLDADDLDYTREVIGPLLDETGQRVSMECLFGDAAGSTLGFTPRGLSPWAGLALARHPYRRARVLPPGLSDVSTPDHLVGRPDMTRMHTKENPRRTKLRRRRRRGDRPEPVDRRKSGTKHTPLVRKVGVPMAIRTAGANASDHRQILPIVLDYPRVRGTPGWPKELPDDLYADRGYDSEGTRGLLRWLGIEPHIARRKTPHGGGLGKVRWVVERTIR